MAIVILVTVGVLAAFVMLITWSFTRVGVLFSVFLWTFLWGLAGAFVGVPITIALLSLAAQHTSSRWLAGLLGTHPQRHRADTFTSQVIPPEVYSRRRWILRSGK